MSAGLDELGRDPSAECDGLCITGADVGVPVWDKVLKEQMVAYPHPSCPRHAPGIVCECGMPDRCTSPTHDPNWSLPLKDS